MIDQVPPPPDDPPDEDAMKRLGAIFATGNDKVVPMKRKGSGKPAKPTSPPPPPRSPRSFRRLPEDCPVVPLGFAGGANVFLDAKTQLRELPADKLSAKGCDDLFGTPSAQEWLDRNFGRIGEGGIINGLDRDLLSRALLAACGEVGFMDTTQRVRGEGGWLSPTGQLVMHVGDAVLTADSDGRLHEGKPGQRDQYIYPLGDAQMRPSARAAEGLAGPGYKLFELLRTWHWKRGDLDAELMLGWITMAPFAGALRWRPAVWIMGDMATGKSTLQDVIEFSQGGRRGLIRASNATNAGIRQALRYRSLPVALDEVEASEDNTKGQAIVELMRASASGAVVLRGGADHTGVAFTVYAPFLFSSINTVPLEPQDVSRLGLLELLPLPRDAVRPSIDAVRLAAIGAGLRRRVIDAWPRWAEHLGPWWTPLNDAFGARTADTFGFLLAFSHLAQCDVAADSDTVAEKIDMLMPSLREWQAVAGRDHERMLNHLGTWQLEPWDKGRRVTVRQLVYWASSRASFDLSEAETERFGTEIRKNIAGRALRQNGLAVVRVHLDEGRSGEFLAIAFHHAGLARIFHGTKWKQGGWRQSAGRAPGARASRQRMESAIEGVVCVPISALLGELEPETGT